MLLLRDLIRDLDIRLVAGEAGLDRPVRWVHISELDDPTPWLSGGELLLTTGMNLADAGSQRAFVERLAGHDLAGLGLGVGFAHAEAPEALREAASELGFPLFEIPYDVPFIALTEKAFSDEECEWLLRDFLSADIFKRGLICRADDRGDPVICLAPPLIAGPEQFEEIRSVLRPAFEEASRRRPGSCPS